MNWLKRYSDEFTLSLVHEAQRQLRQLTVNISLTKASKQIGGTKGQLGGRKRWGMTVTYATLQEWKAYTFQCKYNLVLL